MIPFLYASGTYQTTDNGIGALSDAVSCVVTENRNGSFELEMRYPITGLHYDSLNIGSVISADANPHDHERELFDVYAITRPLNGIVTVRAQHISYRLAGVPVPPFTASNAAAALQTMKRNGIGTNVFTYATDNQTAGNFSLTEVLSTRKIFGGIEGSLLDVFGGEWRFKGTECKLFANRGQNRGVQIRYGKNLTGLSFTTDASAVYSGVCGTWKNDEGSTAYASYWADETHDKGLIVVDFSSDFDSRPETSQLAAKAQAYATANNITAPTVSIDVNFALLSGAQEYASYKILEQVYLCDTVTVIYEALGVNTTAKVNQAVYDCLRGRYTSLKLGDTRNSIANTVSEISTTVKTQVEAKVSSLQQAIDHATDKITSSTGGYVKLYDNDGDGQPDEILVMDSPDKSTAQKVWRWNQSGMGFSSTGYDGPYGYAITADGKLNVGGITAGGIDVVNLSADSIESGTLNAGVVKMLDSESGCGLGVGTGSADGETQTTGAIVWGGSDLPATANNYLISTNAGVRMSSQHTTAAGKLHLAKMYVSSGETGTLAQVSTSTDSSNYARLRFEGNASTLLGTYGSSVISRRTAQIGVASGDTSESMVAYLNFIRNGTSNYTYTGALYAPNGVSILTTSGDGSVNTNAISQSVGTATDASDSSATSISSTGRVDIKAVANRNSDSAMSAVYCNANSKSAPFTQMIATGGAGTASVTLKPNTAEIYGNEITVGTASAGLTVTSKGTTIDGKFVQFGSVSVTSSTSDAKSVSVMYTSNGCVNFKSGTTPAIVISQNFSSGNIIVSDSQYNGFTIVIPKTGSAATRTLGFIAIGQRA